MTYEELKAAYEAAVQKCSELEKENDELKKSNEDQALHIEHLEEQILKRNKMLFGQKSEKSKFICNGQMDLDGNSALPVWHAGISSRNHRSSEADDKKVAAVSHGFRQ